MPTPVCISTISYTITKIALGYIPAEFVKGLVVINHTINSPLPLRILIFAMQFIEHKADVHPRNWENFSGQQGIAQFPSSRSNKESKSTCIFPQDLTKTLLWKMTRKLSSNFALQSRISSQIWRKSGRVSPHLFLGSNPYWNILVFRSNPEKHR